MSLKTRNIVRKRFSTKLDQPLRQIGILGDGSGNLLISGRNNYLYVRVGDAVVEVFNNRVKPAYGLPVYVGYDALEPNRLQVLSTQAEAAEMIGVDMQGSGYAPADRYRWMAPGGGQDPLFVEQRAIMPLRIGISSGTTINVYPGLIWTGTEWVQAGGETVDLSASVPTTTDKARFVLITVDEDGAIAATTGDEVDVDALALADIPEMPDGTLAVLGAVRLYEDMAAIQEARNNTDLVDLRGSVIPQRADVLARAVVSEGAVVTSGGSIVWN